MSSFSWQSAALPPATVAAFRGTEALSELYWLEIFLVVAERAAADLDLEATLGARGVLDIASRPDAMDRHCYHGIIAEIELVHVARGSALLRLLLLPEAWALTLSRHSRIYTTTSVKAVIEDVLSRGALAAPYELSLAADHPDEEHIVQYRESDHAFLSRWLEREGIHYLFRHSADGPETLVMTDGAAQHEASSADPVRYVPAAAQDASAAVAFRSFHAIDRALPTKVAVHDYDYAKPALELAASSELDGEGGEVVDHELRTFSPADAARLAKLRAEQQQCSRSRFVGRGTVFGLRPGHTFALEEHPRSELNQRYLVVRVEHRGADSERLGELVDQQFEQGYQVTVECLPESVPFRPPLVTAWPRIHGYHYGVVTGPASGDYAQLDDDGRYCVKLLFDESALAGDATSTRLRMMQPHTGAPEGWHFPLRAGTEVAVVFLGADPDRPLIAGALPNALNPSVVTADNHTENVLQTGGLSRLEIEDDKGKQFIWLRTPPADTTLNLGHAEHATHQITLHTDKDCLFDIGSNQRVEVGGVLDEQVTGDVTETYLADQKSTIDGPQKTTVTKAVKETYLSSQKTTVTKASRHESFQSGQDTLVLGARQETYASSQAQQVIGTTGETWIGGWTRKVTGATSETHVGNLTELVLGPVLESCPTSVKETYGPTTALWASLLWIAPSWEIRAPSVRMTTTDRTEFSTEGSQFKFNIGKKETTVNSSATLKIERVAAVASFTGLKKEATAVNIAIGGPVLEVGGQKIEISGLIIATGFKIET